MNKQQLASTIWESANQMRSKIEANEYKDFILGFISFIALLCLENGIDRPRDDVKTEALATG